MANKLSKLKKRQHDAFVEMRDLTDKGETESRDLTPDEEKRFTEIESEFERLARQIQRELKLSEYDKDSDDSEEEREVDTRARNGDDSDREEERDSGREIAARPGPFKTLGDQLRSVIQAGTPGGIFDKRLLEVRAPSGMNEQVPADGGFLVQKDFQDELVQRAYETGQLISRVRRVPISPRSNGIAFNVVDETSRATGSRFGGLQLYWLGEAEQKPRSRPKLRRMEMTLKKLAGLLYASDELLEDTTALESWAGQAFGQEFGFMLDDAILRGTGVGQPLGILNSPALVTVAAEGGQGADTIVLQNVLKMYAAFWSPGLTSAAWIINSEIMPQLAVMKLDVGTGGAPVYLPANGLADAPFGRLFGLPMLHAEQSSALGDVGDIMLVDLKEYLVIEKGGIKTASSIHVRFDYDETAFRFVLRIDGQPIWNVPITPYKGAAGSLKSPYVTLAAR